MSPIYEYACECGHKFERLSGKDTKRIFCPECNKFSAKRVVSAPAVKVVGGTPKFHGEASGKKERE